MTKARKKGPFSKLEDGRAAFFEDADVWGEPAGGGVFEEALGRFVQRLVAKAEGAVVHGDEGAGAQFEKGLEGLLGIHVDIALGRVVVGADRQERQLDRAALADFRKAREVSRVSGVENRSHLPFDDKTPKAAVRVVQDACTPMVRRGESDLESAIRKALPEAEFLDLVEAKVMHQVADVLRDDDRLLIGHLAEGFAIEVVKMGVRDQNQIDLGQIVQFDSRMAQALNHTQPFGPIRIDENAVLGGLHEKRGVSDPGDANLVTREGRKINFLRAPDAFGEERGQENFAEEIAFVPTLARAHGSVMIGAGFSLKP